MAEEIQAFLLADRTRGWSRFLRKGLELFAPQLCAERFEFAEDLFDRVEVRRIRREKKCRRVGRLDHFDHTGHFISEGYP